MNTLDSEVNISLFFEIKNWMDTKTLKKVYKEDIHKILMLGFKTTVFLSYNNYKKIL